MGRVNRMACLIFDSMRFLFLFCIASLLSTEGLAQSELLFRCSSGSVQFKSDAPLEMIQAKSQSLKGILNPFENTFAWSVPILSFDGFNNGLQKGHFHENYLETDRYPVATFSGKIIEKVDYNRDQKMVIRAKGKLTIHGVEQERIIKVEVDMHPRVIIFESTFSVQLQEHAINIPKIVHQKIAETVEVKVSGTLTRTQS